MIITEESLLRLPCTDATPDEVGAIIDALETELALSIKQGMASIGLCAPQIQIYKKVAIIRLGTKDLSLNLVNASIEKGYDQFVHKEEGCLSFPNRLEDVLRYNEIVIRDNLVYPKAMILTGLMSVAAQHEIDHYNSILLIDRAIQKPKPKVGPNQLCPCGSKKKGKKCCLK